jgi:hypothetical protein
MNEIDELTSEQLAKAQAVSIMPTCMFVYHDESGNITAISNEKNDSLLYVEVLESKVIDFISGAKDFSKYKIDYFTFNKEDHKEEVANKVNDNREGCAIENEWDNTIYLRGKGLCDLKEDSSSKRSCILCCSVC